jgi:hypothetical protein
MSQSDTVLEDRIVESNHDERTTSGQNFSLGATAPLRRTLPMTDREPAAPDEVSH